MCASKETLTNKNDSEASFTSIASKALSDQEQEPSTCESGPQNPDSAADTSAAKILRSQTYEARVWTELVYNSLGHKFIGFD